MTRLLIKLIGVSLFAGSMLLGWFWMDYKQFLKRPMNLPEEGLLLEIGRGGNVSQLSQSLYQAGVVSSARYLQLLVRLNPELARLKQGEYRIEMGMTPQAALEHLVHGQPVSYEVQFIEGWTFKEFLAELSEAPNLETTLNENNIESWFSTLGAVSNNPEGLFYPDTYHYHKGDTDRAVLERAYNKMQEVLAELWEQRALDLPYEMPYEALIMASIIEKETAVDSERSTIAGVFVERLRRNMRLQTDPTVIYGLGERFDGNLTRAHLREDTAYNTYRIKGLPPTPIAMPARASIEAALRPAETEALYFVARGDGSHQFSKTLAEHNAAVRKYQLKR